MNLLNGINTNKYYTTKVFSTTNIYFVQVFLKKKEKNISFRWMWSVNIAIGQEKNLSTNGL